MPLYKLNFEDVLIIRSERTEKSARVLAEEFNVSDTTIRRIINGKAWMQKWDGLESQAALEINK